MKYVLLFLGLLLMGCSSSVDYLCWRENKAKQMLSDSAVYRFAPGARATKKPSAVFENPLSFLSASDSNVILSGEDIILKHAGEKLFSLISFSSIAIVRKDSIRNFDEDFKKIDSMRCGDAKYCISYDLQFKNKTNYGFSIALDDKGNLVSEIPLPRAIKETRVVGLQAALRIIRNSLDDRPRKFGLGVFQFDQQLNAFIWHIHESSDNFAENGAFETTIYRVNAHNGELISPLNGQLRKNSCQFIPDTIGVE